MAHSGMSRYVFSLIGPGGEEYVIDERVGACAIVYFPDGTYRCVMSPGWQCVTALRSKRESDVDEDQGKSH